MQVKSKHASCRLHYQEERLPMWEQESDSDRRKKASVSNSGYRCWVFRLFFDRDVGLGSQTSVEIQFYHIVSGGRRENGNINFANLLVTVNPDILPGIGSLMHQFRKDISVGIPEYKQTGYLVAGQIHVGGTPQYHGCGITNMESHGEIVFPYGFKMPVSIFRRF